MNTEEPRLSLRRGLALISRHERRGYFQNIHDCVEYVNPLFHHPFGLNLPKNRYGETATKVKFLGAHATDMSVECMLAHIEENVGYTPEHAVTKLRVISTPFDDRKPNQKMNHVFFEFWVGDQVFISGETTDFSGAGETACRDLEGVFAVLALIYGLTIERIQLKKTTRLAGLYAPQLRRR